MLSSDIVPDQSSEVLQQSFEFHDFQSQSSQKVQLLYEIPSVSMSDAGGTVDPWRQEEDGRRH